MIFRKMCFNNSNDSFFENMTDKYLNENREKVASIVCNLNLVFMTFGIVSNIISICVFSNKKILSLKFNWYLLVLTVFQLLFCITLFIDYTFAKFNGNIILLHDINRVFNIIIDFTIHTSDSCATLLTLFLSLDRLYAIKKPLTIKLFFTNLYAKRLICLSQLILITLKVISYSVCQIHISNRALFIYCSLVSPQLFNTLPLMIILILNSLLIKELINSYRNRSSMRVLCRNLMKKQIEFKNLKIISKNTSLSSNNKPCSSTYQRNFFPPINVTHCAVIIISDIWSLLTTIPYYIFNGYLVFIKLNCSLPKSYDFQSIIITQTFFSILFNLNHCTKFFVYISFFSEFRNVFFSFFLNNSFSKRTQTSMKNKEIEISQSNDRQKIVIIMNVKREKIDFIQS